MKRAKLIDRVKLLGEKREELLAAARRYVAAMPQEFDRGRRAAEMEVAAIEYATVAIRYLGGARE